VNEKIAISKEAHRGLVEVFGRISDGFEAGRETEQNSTRTWFA
jgi:hypothetical protein